MKAHMYLLLCLTGFVFCTCTQNRPNKPDKPVKANPQPDRPNAVVPVPYDLKEITHDRSGAYSYIYSEVNMVRDYIPLAADSSLLSKRQFLQKLTTGNFFAVKIALKDDVPVYRLYAFPKKMSDASAGVMQLARWELAHMNWEGKSLPEFHFTDLNGRKYTNASLKGKTTLIKCWFIRCVACVKEFPELNKLVDRYKARQDILFVSLAMDSSPALSAFLKTHKFDYAVVPNTQPYMNDKLQINVYPTHILVGPNGKIIKMVNNASDIAYFLEKQLAPKK